MKLIPLGSGSLPDQNVDQLITMPVVSLEL
jgi:hypothetical protein